MKLNTSFDETLESSGLQQESNFKIQASGQAFKILSDSLYSNKVGAIVRELLCNALDSHTAANQTSKKIKVHLPNSIEPFFEISDYGTGLDHPSVMDLYCTFFQSTKNDSNKQIGGFGLGSKTPFAYCDQFTVVSVFKKVKRTYAAFKKPDGMPSIALVSEEKIDTSYNGLSVSLPVQPKDFSRFQEELRIYGARVLDSIEVLGDTRFKFNPRKEILRGKNWAEFEYNGRAPFIIVVGTVPYVLDHSKFPDIARNYYGYGSESTVEFSTDIGTVDITPSRESLQYTTKTINQVQGLIEEYKKDYKASLVSLIKGSKTYAEALQVYHELYVARSKWGLANTDWFYKGSKLEDKKLEVPEGSLHSITSHYSKSRTTSLVFCKSGYKYSGKDLSTQKVTLKQKIYYQDQLKIHAFKERVKVDYQIGQLEGYVISGLKEQKQVDELASQVKYLETLGYNIFVPISTLPEWVNPNKGIKKAKITNSTIYTLQFAQDRYNYNFFKTYSEYQNEGEFFSRNNALPKVYYLPLEAKAIIFDDVLKEFPRPLNGCDAARYWSFALQFLNIPHGVSIDNAPLIVGIPKASWEYWQGRVKTDLSHWVDLKKVLLEKLKDVRDHREKYLVQDLVPNQSAVDCLKYLYSIQKESFCSSSKLKEFLEKWKDTIHLVSRYNPEETNNFIKGISYLLPDLYQAKHNKLFNKILNDKEALYSHYPLLQYEGPRTETVEYIKALDYIREKKIDLG